MNNYDELRQRVNAAQDRLVWRAGEYHAMRGGVLLTPDELTALLDENAALRAALQGVPYMAPCPKCDGRGFTREYIDGQRESDKCGWCHGGGVVPDKALGDAS